MAFCLSLAGHASKRNKYQNRAKEVPKQITNSKPIPHIPLPFKEVTADVLKAKPPEKAKAKKARPKKT
jgi:hypothetical protein